MLRNKLRTAEAALQHKQQHVAAASAVGPQADRSRTDYGSVLLGVNNLFKRVVDLSARDDVAFEGMDRDTHDVLIRKIRVISEVIADLHALSQTHSK